MRFMVWSLIFSVVLAVQLFATAVRLERIRQCVGVDGPLQSIGVLAPRPHTAACMEPIISEVRQVALPWLLIILLALTVYLGQARTRIRRGGLRPLTGAAADDVKAAIGVAAQANGLDVAPEVYLDLRAGATPTAFGAASMPVIAVAQGTLVDFTANRDRFDAVIAHEMFHLRANDLRTYYWANAIFSPIVLFLSTAGILFAGVIAVAAGPVYAIPIALHVGVLLVLGLAIMRDYLRHREMLADQFAADQVGSTDGLRSALAKGGLSHRGSRWRLPAIFKTHPSPAQRVKALNDPAASTLRMSVWQAFLAGAVAGVFAVTTASVILLSGWDWLIRNRFAVAGALAGIVLVRTLGAGLWRTIYMEAASGQRKTRTGLVLGLIASAGMFAGGAIPMDNVLGLGSPLPVSPLAAGICTATVTGLAVWFTWCARLYQGRDPHGSNWLHFRGWRRWSSLVSAVLLGTAYAALGQAQAAMDDRIAWSFLTVRFGHWSAYVVAGVVLLRLLWSWLGGMRTPQEARASSSWQPYEAPLTKPFVHKEYLGQETGIRPNIPNEDLERTGAVRRTGRLVAGAIASSSVLAIVAAARSWPDALLTGLASACVLIAAVALPEEKLARRIMLTVAYVMVVVTGILSGLRLEDNSAIIVVVVLAIVPLIGKMIGRSPIHPVVGMSLVMLGHHFVPWSALVLIVLVFPAGMLLGRLMAGRVKDTATGHYLIGTAFAAVWTTAIVMVL